MKAAALMRFTLKTGLGAVLAYAGWAKLADAHGFAVQLASYQFLPAVANQLLAVSLPWIELTAGTLLLIGMWPRPAAIVGAGLMGGFMVGAGQALARGLDISCGCFGSSPDSRIGVGTLAIQAACLGAALVIVFMTPSAQTKAPSIG